MYYVKYFIWLYFYRDVIKFLLYKEFFYSYDMLREKLKYYKPIFNIYWKFLILTNFLRLWKAVQISKFSITNRIKNLICVNHILDLKQKQSLKISIIIATKKLCLTFLDKEQSSFHQLAFLLKNIKNKCSRNLLKSLTSLFDVIIFITAEEVMFLKNYNQGGGLILVRKLTYKKILGVIK